MEIENAIVMIMSDAGTVGVLTEGDWDTIKLKSMRIL
jgi:hypothetical protein